MKYREDIEQGTDAWHEAKKGRMSASYATAIGNCGAGLDTYIKNLVYGMFTERNNFESWDMQRGTLLEPEGRKEYEKIKGVKVKEVGGVELGKYIWVSPDGLIDNDGLVEIKCRNNEKHLDLLRTEKVSSGVIWQMQMQMLVTGRKWCDFVSYNPNLVQNLFIKRFTPDEKKFKALENGLKLGEEMIKGYLQERVIRIELGYF